MQCKVWQDRWTVGRTDRQTSLIDRTRRGRSDQTTQAGRQTSRHTGIQAYRQGSRQEDRQTDRETGRQADTQDRETVQDRQKQS